MSAASRSSTSTIPKGAGQSPSAVDLDRAGRGRGATAAIATTSSATQDASAERALQPEPALADEDHQRPRRRTAASTGTIAAWVIVAPARPAVEAIPSAGPGRRRRSDERQRDREHGGGEADHDRREDERLRQRVGIAVGAPSATIGGTPTVRRPIATMKRLTAYESSMSPSTTGNVRAAQHQVDPAGGQEADRSGDQELHLSGSRARATRLPATRASASSCRRRPGRRRGRRAIADASGSAPITGSTGSAWALVRNGLPKHQAPTPVAPATSSPARGNARVVEPQPQPRLRGVAMSQVRRSSATAVTSPATNPPPGALWPRRKRKIDTTSASGSSQRAATANRAARAAVAPGRVRARRRPAARRRRAPRSRAR